MRTSMFDVSLELLFMLKCFIQRCSMYTDRLVLLWDYLGFDACCLALTTDRACLYFCVVAGYSVHSNKDRWVPSLLIVGHDWSSALGNECNRYNLNGLRTRVLTRPWRICVQEGLFLVYFQFIFNLFFELCKIKKKS